MSGQFMGLDALKDTLNYFDWHLAIVVVASLVMSCFAALSGPPPGSSKTGWTLFAQDAVQMLAFALFGFVTAYFLSLGLDRSSDTADNKLLSSFAAPFIALLTAAIAYFQLKNDVSRDRTVAGLCTFLLVCIVSYQTFLYQLTAMRS